MLDFSKEDEQKEFNYGPVPSGSIVIIRTELISPTKVCHFDTSLHQADSGLISLPMQFNVVKGTYEGVRFKEFITIPASYQDINLSDGQRKACMIGGAKIKAMLQAAKKPLSIRDFKDLSGLIFPAKLKVETTTGNDGKEYSFNKISIIVTPEKKEYQKVMLCGEIIADNPLPELNKKNNPQPQSNNAYIDPFTPSEGPAFPSETSSGMDDVPF